MISSEKKRFLGAMGIPLWRTREGVYPVAMPAEQPVEEAQQSAEVFCICADTKVSEDSPLLVSLFKAMVPDSEGPTVLFSRSPRQTESKISLPKSNGWFVFINCKPAADNSNRNVIISDWNAFCQQSKTKRDVWNQISAWLKREED